MTAPRYADCKCSHGKRDHEREGFAPQCTASACTCLRYVPATAPVRLASPVASAIRPAIAPATTGPSVEQLLAAGARSESKRTVQLSEKVAGLLADLRARLTDERKASEDKRRKAEQTERVRAEIAALEADLAAKKAALRGSVSPGASGKPTQPCPTCGKPCVNLGVHRSKAHGWRKDGVA